MDFMKVLDKTVREIKREVNLKVLKVPEIEQKVLDATSDEPWGPHGSDLAEIARETKKFTECQMIMSVLWSRLADTGANWRHVYKSLAVIEYLIANGADRAVDDIIEHTFQISSLSGFEYVEPNGKDVGINVRKKSETILGLLNDREKIKAVRDKAAVTRDKYCGLSSTGITYKSSSTSLSSSSSRNGGYGGFSGYKDKDRSDQEKRSKSRTNNVHQKSRENHTLQNKSRDEGSSSVKKVSSKQGSVPSYVASTSQKTDEDFDDFDPRGSATKSAAPSSFNQVDLFGDSLLVDLMDAPQPVQKEAPVGPVSNATPEVDLFADAAFVSAPPVSALPTDSHIQNKVDLFAFPTAAPVAFQQQTVDLFDTSNTVTISAPKTPPSEPTNGHSFDPFAAVPLNTFAESDDFGDFTSGTCPVKSESSQSSASDILGNLNQPSATPSKQPRKDNFQVKSGIWADSLSRGLIDLNITAPQKVSLADVGVVGALDDLFEVKEKGFPASPFMGRAMGTGAGLGKSNFPSSIRSGANPSLSSFK